MYVIDCTVWRLIIYSRKWILTASIFLVTIVFISYLPINTSRFHDIKETQGQKWPTSIQLPRLSTENNRKRVMKKRFPKCIIFGTMKSGTSALKRLLTTHPKIMVTEVEPHFFDNRSYRKGMKFYLNKMPLSFEDQITIEKTPSYFQSDKARERIYKFNKTIKLIVTFKHPVTRAISNFRFVKSRRRSIKGTFQDFVTQNSGSLNLACRPLNTSLYVDHMKHWYSYFPKEQIHVVDGDRLIKEPLTELRMIEDFLGLEHAITEDNIYRSAETGFYCMRKNSKDEWFCFDRSKIERIKPYVDPNFVQRLKAFYRPYNEQLFRLINRTFDWD